MYQISVSISYNIYIRIHGLCKTNRDGYLIKSVFVSIRNFLINKYRTSPLNVLTLFRPADVGVRQISHYEYGVHYKSTFFSFLTR